jgi:hypothetical protein
MTFLPFNTIPAMVDFAISAVHQELNTQIHVCFINLQKDQFQRA